LNKARLEASFGAHPNDGIDDSTAINSAIEAAKLLGGRTIIFFPEGTYLLKSIIELKTIEKDGKIKF